MTTKIVPTKIVSKMLNEMEENDKHNIIYKKMVFPDTKKINKKSSSVINCNYSCKEEICDFNECFNEINKNSELLKYNSTEFCNQIVQDIKTNQSDYLPAYIDGYNINIMGKTLVNLKRNDSDGKSVTGIIEYIDFRKYSMDYKESQKRNEPKTNSCNIM